MVSNSILDTLLSFFNGAWRNGAIMMLPWLLFDVCEIWFGAVGWSRQRAVGFLWFLAAGATGLIAGGISLSAMAAGSQGMPLFNVSSALHFIAGIFMVTGLGMLAYRAAAPSNPPAAPQP